MERALLSYQLGILYLVLGNLGGYHMSHIRPWNRVACAVTLAAFSTSVLLPQSARAELPQAKLNGVVKDIQSGIQLAQQSKQSRDVVEFIQEEISTEDLQSIVSLLTRVDSETLPKITVQGSTIRFGKPSDNIPELKVIDAANGRFRYGKKELIVREGMSFEEFYSQFQARLDGDSETITSLLWSLLVEKAQADEDVVITDDHARELPSAPVNKGMSTGAKIAIAVGAVLVVALVAFLIYKVHKDKKDKEAEDLKKAEKKEKEDAKEKEVVASYSTVKTSYDNARGDYEARCNHYPEDSQLWNIAPEGATEAQKIAAMNNSIAKLKADSNCSVAPTTTSPTSH